MVGLFEQISEAHELYGAKHQDWQRYSKYCSSNARSIRKKHPSVVGCTSNGKFTGKTTPSFAKCPPSSIPDIFQLFVWEAEKAWSEYMGCKEKVQKYGSSSSSSLSNRQLRHARRRLVVSLKHAETARNFATKIAESQNDLSLGKKGEERKFSFVECESISYIYWIEALLANELNNWQKCYEKSCLGIKILEQLQKNSTSSSSIALFQKRIEIFLIPLNKFSLYNLKKGGGGVVESISIELPSSFLNPIPIEFNKQIQPTTNELLLTECLNWVNKIQSNPTIRIPSSKLDKLIYKFNNLIELKIDFPERPVVRRIEMFIHSIKLINLFKNKNNTNPIRIGLIAIDLLTKLKNEIQPEDNLLARVESLLSDISISISHQIISTGDCQLKCSIEQMNLTSPTDQSFVECKPICFDLAYNYFN